MARTLPIRLRTLAATVVVIASGLMIFNAYQSIINSTDEPMASLPIIKADSKPFRVVPKDRGGMDIPNQGNTVFNFLKKNNDDAMALDGIEVDTKDDIQEPIDIIAHDIENPIQGFELPEIPEPKTESLFDTQPQNELKEKLEKAIDKAMNKAEQQIETLETLAEDTENASPATSPNDLLIRPKPKPSRPLKKVEVPKQDQSPKEFSLDRILAQDPIQKRHYIQLASLKNDADARASYAKIREHFPKLVDGVSVFFPKADLGARGVFTRIQIGPLDANDARARCARYSGSSNGGTCLVISR